MAKEKGLIQALRGMPAESAAVIARKFAKADLSRLGKIRVLPNGIPIDDVTISVLPHGPAEAKKLIDLLVAQPSIGGFEVFPYGIVAPEIARIDIKAHGR